MGGVVMAWPYQPVVDVPAIEALGDEVGDRRALIGFLQSFIELLPGRVESITAATEPELLADRSQGFAATAKMAGAARLAQCVEKIRRHAVMGHLPSSRQIEALNEEARETGSHLGAYARGLGNAN